LALAKSGLLSIMASTASTASTLHILMTKLHLLLLILPRPLPLLQLPEFSQLLMANTLLPLREILFKSPQWKTDLKAHLL
jgi:hypothetical protein